ncbi:hypothetical protein HELRODRAFT_172986 [Helobdella robusta]|uniref:Uncharacterized protein n=1 Tax=Helobdella robusta TaxID=6412 RepID=T1F689_HELRO|nr:hypothetical protein HELRODRAFT_172986 [Helobdella robusta]ESO03951.1 hypothetical protein HELRODRAFT_172986 [Helobdella robusta]
MSKILHSLEIGGFFGMHLTCSICLDKIVGNFAYLAGCLQGFFRACIDQWRKQHAHFSDPHPSLPSTPHLELQRSNFQVIEHFLNIMRCNVSIDQLFPPDKLIQQIYDFIFNEKT